MRKRCTVVFFAVLALVAATAAAQTHESITVQVVDVPVYVFSHGKPIRNLTKDDFKLFVNGKPQTIDYFDPIDFSPVAAAAPDANGAVPPAANPRERRLFLLLFDLAFNRPAALHRARAAAGQMVDRALPRDYFGVAITTSRGAKFIILFTLFPYTTSSGAPCSSYRRAALTIRWRSRSPTPSGRMLRHGFR